MREKHEGYCVAIFRKTVCSSKGGDGGGDSAPSVIGHEERQEVV